MGQEHNPIQSPDPPNPSSESIPSPQFQTPTDGIVNPTHYSHDVVLHTDVEQLFVSTQNYIYGTSFVELGESAWQCKGTMDDT
jgi:hypothetical protein